MTLSMPNIPKPNPGKEDKERTKDRARKGRRELAEKVDTVRTLKDAGRAANKVVNKWKASYAPGKWPEINEELKAATGLSAREIQAAVGAVQDGRIGPNTLGKIASFLAKSHGLTAVSADTIPASIRSGSVSTRPSRTPRAFRSKKEEKKATIDINEPKEVKDYRESVGEVELTDSEVRAYKRSFERAKKEVIKKKNELTKIEKDAQVEGSKILLETKGKTNKEIEKMYDDHHAREKAWIEKKKEELKYAENNVKAIKTEMTAYGIEIA